MSLATMDPKGAEEVAPMMAEIVVMVESGQIEEALAMLVEVSAKIVAIRSKANPDITSTTRH